MSKQYRSLYFIAILVAVLLAAPPTGAFTDLRDVVALQDLYKTLNQPPLKGWRLEGGDPCDESWHGVSCFGSSVIHLKLNGLNLTGSMTPKIYNLYSLKQLDVSSNSIGGEILYVLLLNATHINMAYNHLIQNIPPSLPGLKSLRHLNLSHNLLSGPIGDAFTGLQNLREMDLSYNNFTAQFPSSFGSLTNLTGLYLQSNQFTGSVAYLAELPLIDLNIKDNYFSGIIPSHFQLIPNLWIGWNSFHLPGDNYPPWEFPLATQSSAMEKRIPFTKLGGHKKRRLGPGGIAFMIGGGTLVVSCVALYIVHRIKQSRAQKLITLGGSNSSSHSFRVKTMAKGEISRNFRILSKQYQSLYFIAILVAVLLAVPPAGAFTDLRDVVALRDLYKTLNKPRQLKGWSLEDGDPCEIWLRVACLNYSVVELKLDGLNLTGYISAQISNLYSLKQLDVSSNSIGGEIPYLLPPNLVYIDLAYNHFIQNIPPLRGMKSLRHLNLSHNLLSGPIGEVFTGLTNLKEMDLSYNNFTGDLPSSFGSLTNLTGLYLQSNQFTGSVAYLGKLPLIDLNLENNYFSGIIPSHFRSIPNLWTDGNSWQHGISEQNIHPSPETGSNPEVGRHEKRKFGHGRVVFVIGVAIVVGSCVTIYIGLRLTIRRFGKLRDERLRGSNGLGHSFTVITTEKVLPSAPVVEDYSFIPASANERRERLEGELVPLNSSRLMVSSPQV